MSKHIKIKVCEEPEIQYTASPELFDEIREWLYSRGGTPKKTPEHDTAVYYDTKNYRLLREGVEYRVKEKGALYRHDMKVPMNTRSRVAVPDENDILWRNELKLKTSEAKPRLADFFGHALLKPIQQRVHRFFDKELVPQFRSSFLKEKIDHECENNSARVEYSFQTGQMETIDQSGRTKILHILELELRDGDSDGLLEEKAALEEAFGPKGLVLLPERKIMIGFELLAPSMSEKQRHSFEDARIRSSRVDHDRALAAA